MIFNKFDFVTPWEFNIVIPPYFYLVLNFLWKKVNGLRNIKTNFIWW